MLSSSHTAFSRKAKSGKTCIKMNLNKKKQQRRGRSNALKLCCGSICFSVWFFLQKHSVRCVGNDYPWANFVLQLAESIEKFICWHFIRLAVNEKLLFLRIRYWCVRSRTPCHSIRGAFFAFMVSRHKPLRYFRGFMDCFPRHYS